MNQGPSVRCEAVKCNLFIHAPTTLCSRWSPVINKHRSSSEPGSGHSIAAPGLELNELTLSCFPKSARTCCGMLFNAFYRFAKTLLFLLLFVFWSDKTTWKLHCYLHKGFFLLGEEHHMASPPVGLALLRNAEMRPLGPGSR